MPRPPCRGRAEPSRRTGTTAAGSSRSRRRRLQRFFRHEVLEVVVLTLPEQDIRSRVNGQGSRVKGQGSRVKGQGSRDYTSTTFLLVCFLVGWTRSRSWTSSLGLSDRFSRVNVSRSSKLGILLVGTALWKGYLMVLLGKPNKSSSLNCRAIKALPPSSRA